MGFESGPKPPEEKIEDEVQRGQEARKANERDTHERHERLFKLAQEIYDPLVRAAFQLEVGEERVFDDAADVLELLADLVLQRLQPNHPAFHNGQISFSPTHDSDVRIEQRGDQIVVKRVAIERTEVM